MRRKRVALIVAEVLLHIRQLLRQLLVDLNIVRGRVLLFELGQCFVDISSGYCEHLRKVLLPWFRAVSLLCPLLGKSELFAPTLYQPNKNAGGDQAGVLLCRVHPSAFSDRYTMLLRA